MMLTCTAKYYSSWAQVLLLITGVGNKVALNIAMYRKTQVMVLFLKKQCVKGEHWLELFQID